MNRLPTAIQVSPKMTRRLQVFTGLGVVAMLLGAATQPERLWPNLLLLGFLAVGFGLGGMLLIAFHDLTGARWDQSLRGLRESMAATLTWTAPFLAVVLLVGFSYYPWTQAGALGEPTEWFKRWWLEPGFFTARAIAYLLIWVLFALAMVRASRRAGDGGPTPAGYRLSAAFAVVFAITFWLASTDFIMSLEPGWYSTMFGVYNFGGVLLSAQAAIALLAIRMRHTWPLRGLVTRDQMRDMGILILSYSCLWMYFWFSQFMLIWYTNMPEETAHYASRAHGLWAPVFYANIVINWAIPFGILLRRPAKEDPNMLGRIATLVLVGRWLDLYLMILPSTGAKTPMIGFCEVGSFALAIGGLGLILAMTMRKAPQFTPVETTHPPGVALAGSRADR